MKTDGGLQNKTFFTLFGLQGLIDKKGLSEKMNSFHCWSSRRFCCLVVRYSNVCTGNHCVVMLVIYTFFFKFFLSSGVQVLKNNLGKNNFLFSSLENSAFEMFCAERFFSIEPYAPSNFAAKSNKNFKALLLHPEAK